MLEHGTDRLPRAVPRRMARRRWRLRWRSPLGVVGVGVIAGVAAAALWITYNLWWAIGFWMMGGVH